MKSWLICWFMRRLSPSDRLVLTHQKLIAVMPLRLWLPWIGLKISSRFVRESED